MSTALREAIRAAAREVGLARVGVAPAATVATAPAFRAWLAAGHAGDMAYLAREPELRESSARLLEGARSVLVALVAYEAAPAPPAPGTGLIAAYARGADYHHLLRERLRALAAALPALAGRPVATRVAVDTAPLLERAVAARAGLGFFGKNTMLITPGVGSYTLLGAVVTDLDLPPDDPSDEADGGVAPPRPPHGHCGRCTACLDACPTAALRAPYVLDARRCLAYLTIELAGPVPPELRPLVGDRIFGCDACQAACPFNRHPAPGDPGLAPRAAQTRVALADLVALRSAGYHRLTRGTALRRVRAAQLQRNAAVALGNAGDRAAVPALAGALAARAALVRGHAAWALGRLGGAAARAALAAAQARETDPGAAAAIAAALAAAG
ncbi:MAG TPA: tRNA epoxyqueuosine(34) reductase QueG [Polyangia bacterium]|jgi:epoxyqueuosine reductase